MHIDKGFYKTSSMLIEDFPVGWMKLRYQKRYTFFCSALRKLNLAPIGAIAFQKQVIRLDGDNVLVVNIAP